MIVVTLLIITIAQSSFADTTKSYTVYRLTPRTKQQVDFLHRVYINNTKLDFWREPSQIGSEVHVMIGDSTERVNFLSAAIAEKITIETMIQDVEQLIIQRANEDLSARRRRRPINRRLLLRDDTGRPNFNLAQYHSFGDIINYLNTLAVTYPDRVQVLPIGTTHEGRQIPLIKIGTRNIHPTKPGVWVDGGIHAREWVSPSTVLYMIDQLVTNYDSDTRIRNYVDQLDWYIAPLLNPDGYEYSRSTTSPEIRLWRKNRSPQVCTRTPTLFTGLQTSCCSGVDLNRNFDWQWGTVGSSNDPCSEIYQGASSFSEPETRAVRDFLATRRNTIRAFLTFHSYSQILMYPFGHQQRSYPPDVQELRTTALQAAQALRQLYGTNYQVGTGADTLYPASGGSEDWAKGQMGVKYSYLFELRPEEHVWDGFLLAENQILPTAKETWEAVKVIADSVMTDYPPSGMRTRPTTTPCVDRDALCGYWSQNGACTAWPSMRERCPRSCGLCGNNGRRQQQQTRRMVSSIAA